MKNDYIPFLKLKSNEIAALKELALPIKSSITPFFDLPKKRGQTGDSLKTLILKAAKSVAKNLSTVPSFYLDNYDIDDAILVDGGDNYAYACMAFSQTNFIPVLGLDRPASRNSVVFAAKVGGLLKSDTVAIRLMSEDFSSYSVIFPELQSLLRTAYLHFNKVDFVIDNRLCSGIDPAYRSVEIANFVGRASADFLVNRWVITGSSLPASARDIIDTESELVHPRSELEIFRGACLRLSVKGIYLGDYTVVSPFYSDPDIPAAALRNITTAKVTYSYDDVHYIRRGGSLRSHARGELQYNDIAAEITKLPFFRGAPYSFGDKFIAEKSNFIGSTVTASTILKPTINLHMTYMANGFII